MVESENEELKKHLPHSSSCSPPPPVSQAGGGGGGGGGAFMARPHACNNLEGVGSSMPHPLSINQRIICMQVYDLVQAAVWNLEVVHYSGAAIALHMEISVGTCSSVR